MNPCPECKGPKTMTADEEEPDRVLVWEKHTPGCSWSPMIKPDFHEWRMRSIPRTDSVPGTS